MKNLILLAFTSLLFISCEKIIEEAQDDVIADTISNGKWVVSSYLKGNQDVTNDFSGYTFQFQKNNTVDAIKNNIIEKTGTWQANATDYTITSEFVNAAYPLPLLNGTWQLTDASDTRVIAHKNVNGEVYNLKLAKQ